jgi:simple sugar transport system ATP-binding protein/ribose transport system ATP-binding protein
MMAESSNADRISLEGVSKRFGMTTAVAGVSLSFAPGEVHALVGENGAGKSTVGKILLGVHRPDEGELVIDGEAAHFHHPRAALAAGIVGMSQEMSLAPSLSAVDSLFLGDETNSRVGLIGRRRERARFAELSEQVGFEARPGDLVRDLSPINRKRLELMRALAIDARLVVMDEPTAAMTKEDAARLFDRVRELSAAGVSILYISHFLDEVRDLSDRISILRDGELVRTSPAAEETTDSLIVGMLGRPLVMTFPEIPPPSPDAEPLLRVEGVSANKVENVSFEVRRGEVVALAGLVGAGRTEIGRAIFGADRRKQGVVSSTLRGGRFRSPRGSINSGLAYLSEDRRNQGIIPGRSIAENATISAPSEVGRFGLVSRRRERAVAEQLCERLEVRHGHVKNPIETLSGGNQQKVLLGRCLLQHPDVLIVDEPTRGIDVGARLSIYERIAAAVAEGRGVILVSSEMEEVIGLAHRVLVVRGGAIVAELSSQVDDVEDRITRSAFGVADTREVTQ